MRWPQRLAPLLRRWLPVHSWSHLRTPTPRTSALGSCWLQQTRCFARRPLNRSARRRRQGSIAPQFSPPRRTRRTAETEKKQKTPTAKPTTTDQPPSLFAQQAVSVEEDWWRDTAPPSSRAFDLLSASGFRPVTMVAQWRACGEAGVDFVAHVRTMRKRGHFDKRDARFVEPILHCFEPYRAELLSTLEPLIFTRLVLLRREAYLSEILDAVNGDDLPAASQWLQKAHKDRSAVLPESFWKSVDASLSVGATDPARSYTATHYRTLQNTARHMGDSRTDWNVDERPEWSLIMSVAWADPMYGWSIARRRLQHLGLRDVLTATSRYTLVSFMILLIGWTWLGLQMSQGAVHK